MRHKQIIFGLFFGLLFIYGLAINFHMALWADDYGRSLTGHNLSAIIENTYKTYFHWSGRVTVIFATYLFLLKDTITPLIFNILNPAIFVALIYGMFLLAYNKTPHKFTDLARLIFILTLTWFIPTKIGEVVFWKTGAIGYLWPITCSLYFLYPYKQLTKTKNVVRDNFFIITGMFLLGLALGMCLENLSVALSIALLTIIIYCHRNEIKNIRWAYAGLIGHIIGTVLLLTAPGNFIRVKDTIDHINHMSFFMKSLMFMEKVVVHFLPFIIISLLLIKLLDKYDQQKLKRQLKQYYFFLGISLLLTFAMFGAPGAWFSGRATFASDVYIIIAIATLFSDSSWHKEKFSKIILFICVPLLIFDMCQTYNFYQIVWQQVKTREMIITQSLANGIRNVTLPPIYYSEKYNTINDNTISSYRFFVGDWTQDWTQDASATYYNLNSIKLENKTK